MKIGRFEFKYTKRKSFKEKNAENLNYINGKVDINSAAIRVQGPMLDKHRERLDKVEETMKTIALVLDGMTKK